MEQVIETLRNKPRTQRMAVIIAGALIVVAGLFPPWMFTFHRSGTGQNIGWQSERNAGYALVFQPPAPRFFTFSSSDEVEVDDSDVTDVVYASFGVRLDTHRLLIEWICILVTFAVVWWCGRPK